MMRCRGERCVGAARPLLVAGFSGKTWLTLSPFINSLRKSDVVLTDRRPKYVWSSRLKNTYAELPYFQRDYAWGGIVSISYVPSVAGEGVTGAVTSTYGAMQMRSPVSSLLCSFSWSLETSWNKENIGCVCCAPVLLTCFFLNLP